jgi:hypothetical protein
MKIVCNKIGVGESFADKVIVASKFFEHFILISDAMTFRNQDGETSLWNEEDR